MAPQTREPDERSAASGNPDRATALAPSLAELADHVGIAVFTWDTEADRVYHSAISHHAPAPPQGTSFRALLEAIGATDIDCIVDKVGRARTEGDSGHVRVAAHLPDGQDLVFNATFFPHGADRPCRYVQIVSQDLTRLARAEKARAESEAHYRNSVALNPEIPWVADRNGQIVEVGPRWGHVVGTAPETALGSGWTDYVHPEDRDEVVRQWLLKLDNGMPVDIEYRIRHADGQYRWMRARARPSIGPAGEILRWYGTLEDVHDRHLTIAALRESEEFSRSILDSGSIATEVLDLDGRLTYMNRPGLAMMEVDDFEAVRGLPYVEVWPSEVRPQIAKMITAARSGAVMRDTLFGPTAKGTPRWWDFTLAPVRDAEGNIARLLALSHDVTETHHSQLEAAEAARRLSAVLEGTLDNVVSLDREFRITYYNQRAVQEFPFLGGAIGKDVRSFFDPAELAPFLKPLEAAITDCTTVAFENYLPSAAKWFEIQADCRTDAITVFFRDVTARREAQDRVAHLARHDALTGLANRIRFRERFQELIAEPKTGHLAVMAIDLDDFKQVNDSLGHPAGDALLRQVAMRLGICTGGHGLVARFGGDEFALLAKVASAGQAAAIAQACLSAVMQPYRLGDDLASVGASIGIALTPDDGTDPDIVLNHADIALYQVKDDHGAGYRFFEAAMDQAQRERRKFRSDLSVAIKRREFAVVYQPQIDLKSGRLAGFEALLRWHSPERGTVSPGQFIPVAEETGQIDELGAFVIAEAVRDACSWPDHLRLAVNLSPTQFRSRALLPMVTEALRRTGFDPHRLEVEITESVLLEQSDTAIALLGDLHRMGISVALDDFGTGYSSLSYLRRFPFDRIKIDRSFVADLPGSSEATAIVRAIIGLGRALRAEVTAEGVETWEQLAALEDEGCNDAQGYLFSPPLPTTEAARFAAVVGKSGFTPIAERRRLARHG